MREILFRGRRIDNGEWVEGALLDGKEHCIIGQSIKFSPYVLHECKFVGFEVERKTICQYTGLTDKNGRKIFEGDIICNHYDDEHPEDESFCTVVWEKSSWRTRESYMWELEKLDDFCTKSGEVVGNIFDNPELMEGERC